jgi:hypothetical protein
MTSVRCFAHGRDADWEAICIDFDIAVQGRSFDEVKSLLNGAVQTYIQDACKEEPVVRDRLLNRRAPWHVRLALTARLVFFNVFDGRNGEAQASFPVACPA